MPERRSPEPRPDRWPPRPGAALWGLHAVAAAWTNPVRRCRALWLTDAGAEALTPALAEAKARGLDRPAPTPIERRAIDRALSPGTVHQGIVLDAAPLEAPSLDALIGRDRPLGCVILLDQVTDPHNVGAILRSAAVFGADAVVTTDRHAPEAAGALAKAASGACELVPLVRVPNLARAITDLKGAPLWCLGLDAGGARPLAAAAIDRPVALVLGAEGRGLRRLTRERCDELVSLPTGGDGFATLNVSTAAAVALYEVARQRRSTEGRA